MIEAVSISFGAFLGVRLDLRAIRRQNRLSCVIYALRIAKLVGRNLYIDFDDVEASRGVCLQQIFSAAA